MQQVEESISEEEDAEPKTIHIADVKKPENILANELYLMMLKKPQKRQQQTQEQF